MPWGNYLGFAPRIHMCAPIRAYPGWGTKPTAYVCHTPVLFYVKHSFNELFATRFTPPYEIAVDCPVFKPYIQDRLILGAIKNTVDTNVRFDTEVSCSPYACESPTPDFIAKYRIYTPT